MTPISLVTSTSYGEAHRYARYMPLCLESLRRALNRRTHLFSRQFRNAEWQDTWGNEDLTSTCICLIGVSRSGIDPTQLALDPPRTLEATIRRVARSRYEGALGLLVWANAVSGGMALDELVAATGLSLGDGSAYVARLNSMEAAWLLSGLLHEQVRNPQTGIRRIAETAMRSLEERYLQSGGLMPHATTRAPWKARVRRHVANFADQIYTVQALAFAYLVLGASPALDVARRLAARLVALQGPRGQWWWQYDARAGGVAEPFPVYSVHQYAMAPMAFMALEAAGGGAFTHAITASHDWLTSNELGVSMIDDPAQTIWRDVERHEGALSRSLHQLLLLGGLSRRGPADRVPALRLNQETRPYEWAWCLYAGAIANGVNRGYHLV